ncbi:putative disease resistance protein RGA1 [Ziziphus jujuba]|uniref:Disease resistance protein RGA1 n=1 Tax=Ziziphus jujuba TaxID=326968 RepID=A0ABM4A0G3_ZIZJJ|nr:putative disease resistance protein RGA1 [Ziziphus jujuba]XP_060670222.1 putative disease resistance protein RGA1 [Ziziphus jujuba]
MLYNLQTLKLSYCTKLQELPRDLNKLVNLVSLEIDMCTSLTHMPGGLGQLTNLQTLSRFVLKEGTSHTTIKSKHSCDHEVGELSDLMGLNNIRGKLSIINLGNGDQDSKAANLKDKQHLCSLCLCWHVNYYYAKLCDDLFDGHINLNYDLHLPSYLKDVEYEATLEGLQPHPNLKELCLQYYEGVEFPSWLPSHANLEYLFLKNSLKCQYLPPLNGLVSLKKLKLGNMLGLEYISNGPPEPSRTSVLLPALEMLEFTLLPNLKGWWRTTDINNGKDGVSMNDHVSLSLPRLCHSVIIKCPKLSFLPLSPNIKSLAVQNNTWKPFHLAVLTASTFSNLSLLSLSDIEDLQSLPEWFKCLTCIRSLGIMECNNLTSLSPGIQQLASSLENLRIQGCQQLDMFNDVGDPNFWEALTSLRALDLSFLPQLRTHLPQGVQHLTSLQKLTIDYCSNLISIDSEWMTNLKSLDALMIHACPNLTSLPQGIRHLTSLHTLEIVDCPILFKTCQTDIGEHWPKVAHVPNFILNLTTISDDDDDGSPNHLYFSRVQLERV